MLTNFKWQICKGDVNIGTLIVPQTFKKASVKNGHMAYSVQPPSLGGGGGVEPAAKFSNWGGGGGLAGPQLLE